MSIYSGSIHVHAQASKFGFFRMALKLIPY